jgi:metal-responsive CopG/Arc/MetJ family transcriptional regulator
MLKIQISIDEELLKKIDVMADAHYTNRSAYISMTMASVIMQHDKVFGLVGDTLNAAKDDLVKQEQTKEK